MRPFETNENEVIVLPIPRNDAKTPHSKRFNIVMELTSMAARGWV